VEKIMEVDSHIGAAMSGLIPDARTLVDHARVEAQNHRFSYNEPVRVEALTQVLVVVVVGGGGRRGRAVVVVIMLGCNAYLSPPSLMSIYGLFDLILSQINYDLISFLSQINYDLILVSSQINPDLIFI